jgi:hypothetical protein
MEVKLTVTYGSLEVVRNSEKTNMYANISDYKV